MAAPIPIRVECTLGSERDDNVSHTPAQELFGNCRPSVLIDFVSVPSKHDSSLRRQYGPYLSVHYGASSAALPQLSLQIYGRLNVPAITFFRACSLLHNVKRLMIRFPS